MAHEYIYLTLSARIHFFYAMTATTLRNRQIARFINPKHCHKIFFLRKSGTPECKSIEELATFLRVEKSRTAKAVFLVATISEGEQNIDRFVFAIIRVIWK